MVLYTCEKCNKTFNKKSNYQSHLNKKNPCIKKEIKNNNNSIIFQNIPNDSKIFQNKNNCENIKTKCAHCSKIFSTVTNLNKHLRTSCKVKKQNELDKEQIFKQLLEQNNKQLNEYKEQLDSALKQIKVLSNEVTRLKSNKKSIKNNNVSINSNNTTTNNIINIVDFGKEDLTIVDKAEFVKVLNNRAINGFKITDELVKAIHFNDKYPQLNNVYISDINRNKFMIVQDNKWTLTHVDQIPRVIENAVQYSYDKNEELSKKCKNNKF